MKRTRRTFLLALGLFAFLASGVSAQEGDDARGQVRGQLQPLNQGAPAAIPTFAPRLVDYREEMRKFIQSIASFGRQYNPNFIVVVQNGLDLLNKAQEEDETKTVPAVTYMRTINGILVEGLSFGDREPGKPPTPERRKKMEALVEQADRARLRVFTADWTPAPQQAEAAIRYGLDKGYIPFTAPAGGLMLNRIPEFPKIPVGENPKSILSLGDVENYIWITDSAAFGREDEYAFALHHTNHDLIITETFHGLRPLSKQAVETLKYKYLGAKRLVMAHVDIGTAASYRYYWKSNWREGSPMWISAPLKDNPDRYWVEYWRPEWQAVISGNTESYVYGVIRQGYDGVVLGGIEAYRFFEGTLRDNEEENALEGAPAMPEGAPEGGMQAQ